MKNRLLILMFVLLMAAVSNECTTKKTVQQQKPNILFIFADDLNFNTIHDLGNDEVITPTLDKMSHEGVTFTHAYNMGAWHGAVCVASRTMLNTGRSVWRAYKSEKKLQERAHNRQLWGQMMHDAGYETYFSGKWHVKISPDSVFDHVSHVRPGMPNDSPEGYNRPVEGKPDAWSPYDKKFGGYWKGGTHWSEVLAQDAEGFLANAAKSEKPFFMYLAFNAAHDPRQSPKKFVDMYPLDKISVPKTFMPEYPYNGKIGYGREMRDERLAPFPRTEYAVKVNRQEYYALITHMDTKIKRILDALEKTGKKDNTYIFFTADHGLACGNHGLMGKQNMYDHSLRPPMMVIGPNVPKDKKIDEDVYLQDVMASALDLAGVQKPDFVEFHSVMDMARGKTTQGNYPAIYGCYTNSQRMIRTNGYKLIVYPFVPTTLLFDENSDPLEMNNLSESPKFDNLKKDMFGQLVNLQKSMADSVDITATFPELAK